MPTVNRRSLEWLYNLPLDAGLSNLGNFKPELKSARLKVAKILLAIVLLSWGYVIYATRIAAKWQLKEMYPIQAQNI